MELAAGLERRYISPSAIRESDAVVAEFRMQYTLTALSPLHIGRGEQLSPLDYAVVKDQLVVFDPTRKIDRNPEVVAAVLAAAEPTVNLLLSGDEQAAAEFRRYVLSAPEFVRSRLRGEPPPRPAAPAKPVPVPVAPAAPRKDLRGGLGQKLAIRLGPLPPGPSAPAAAPKPSIAAAPKPAVEPKPEAKPERDPVEKLVSAFLKQELDERVYLPGSSIRGALRTAVLYDLVDRDPGLLEQLAGDLQSRMHDNAFSSRAAEDELDGYLSPRRAYGRADWLSSVIVGDSESASPSDTLSVEMSRCWSPWTGEDGLPMAPPEPRAAPRGGPPGRGPGRDDRGRDDRPDAPRPMSFFKGPPLYLETVRTRSKFTGRFHIADHLHKGEPARGLGWHPALGVPTVEALCKAANNFALAVTRREIEHYRNAPRDFRPVADFYRDLETRIAKADGHTAHLSVGYGAGWHRLTVGGLLEKMPHLNLGDLRKKYHLAPHRMRSRFPKTRRLVMDSFFSPRAPLGWVELKFS